MQDKGVPSSGPGVAGVASNSVGAAATAGPGILWLFTLTTFASALLLFSVQPMFAKMVLPRLGGAPGVWSVALVFFQGVLLAGYAYAHLLIRFAGPRLGYADADGHRPVQPQAAAHVGADALGDQQGIGAAGARQQHREFFAAVTRGDVAGPQRQRQQTAGLAQGLVAGRMAEAVVVGLEVVQIEQQQREREAVTLAAFEQAHRARFGFFSPERAIVIESVVVEAIVAGEPVAPVPLPPRDGGLPAPLDHVTVWTGGADHRTPVHDRAGLRPGDRITGPVLIREAIATTMVEPGWTVDVGADFVHLGQEDLAEADIATIKAAGVRLGISTHDEAELAVALAAEPDYVALGPIWETKLKVMKWAPQGLDRVRAWKQRIGDLPLCAIGGITPERAPSVLAAGADCVAVITDFFTHPDPEERVRQWLSWAENMRRA